MIGMSGFSEAVRTEKGVRDLKEIGADFASGIPWKDRATLDLFDKYGLKAVVKGLPGWWGGKTKWAGQMAERRPLAAFEKAAATWQAHPAILSVVVGDEPSKLDMAHYGKVFELVRAKTPDGLFSGDVKAMPHGYVNEEAQMTFVSDDANPCEVLMIVSTVEVG